MESYWTVTIGFTFFDLAVKTWTVCQEKSSPKILRVKVEAVSAAWDLQPSAPSPKGHHLSAQRDGGETRNLSFF
jgi:hypothetical protein